ncbi:hypothetical protein AXG93_1275s1110 [Marchantia polymorpha subsp. ruderalis]|uniref:Uncharacterized protein n=1 Tax=Marchantia polymorpha subsp. ruderalis TaxID=1480154 RepID=A0A176VLC3_MARPO|nr:hypothetical protein AXG93_1275s1110 [Marchantia polymorpha subsp. ruderalis]
MESSEGAEEEDHSRPRIPPQTTARKPVQVEVLLKRHKQNGDWRRGGRCSVEKTIAPTNVSAEVAADEPIQPVITGEPSVVTVKVPAEIVVEVGGTVRNVTEDLEPPPLEEEVRSKAAVTPRNTAEAKSEGDILQRKSHINPEVFPIKHYRG